jgi:hypothetical protein
MNEYVVVLLERIANALDKITRSPADESSVPVLSSNFKTFLDAMVLVEYGKPDIDGGYVLKKGDGGRSIGPLQIQRPYWTDAQILGRYEQVTSLPYAVKTMVNYMLRYCPDALFRDEWETMARIHNGGPNGHRIQATVGYWLKIKARMERV